MEGTTVSVEFFVSLTWCAGDKVAQAQNVSVTLSYMGDSVLLDVQDDGVGLNGAKPSPFGGGFGLQAMRERVAQYNGELLLESEPGGGTTLVVSIPIT